MRTMLQRPLHTGLVQRRDRTGVDHDPDVGQSGGQGRAQPSGAQGAGAGALGDLGLAVAGLGRLAAHGTEHAAHGLALAAEVIHRILRLALSGPLGLADGQVERHESGWAFRPLKKIGFNQPLEVVPNPGYGAVVAFLIGKGPPGPSRTPPMPP